MAELTLKEDISELPGIKVKDEALKGGTFGEPVKDSSTTFMAPVKDPLVPNEFPVAEDVVPSDQTVFTTTKAEERVGEERDKLAVEDEQLQVFEEDEEKRLQKAKDFAGVEEVDELEDVKIEKEETLQDREERARLTGRPFRVNRFGEIEFQDAEGGIFEDGNGTITDDDIKVVEEASVSISNDIEELDPIFDDRFNQIDATLVGTIADIKAQYEKRRRIQEDINKRVLGSLTKLGIRRGRQRFASEIQTSILSNEERAGAARISDLIAEEKSLNNQARAAAETNQFNILIARMDAIDKIKERKRQAFLDLAKLAKEQSDAVAAKAKAQIDQDKEDRAVEKDRREQNDRVAGFLAPSLIVVGDDFEISVATNAEIQAFAEASNISFGSLLGAVNSRADALRKEKREEVGSVLDRMKFQAGEDQKDFSNQIALAKALREEELQPFKLAEAERKAKGELLPAQKFDQEFKLTSQFEGLIKDSRKAVEQIGVIEIAGKAARKAIKEGTTLNPASQGILVAFQKLLDPTSVVRESEYARSGQGLSLLNRLDGLVLKLKQGGANVPLEELEAFVDLAMEFSKGYKSSTLNHAFRIKRIAERNDLDLESILTRDIIEIMNEEDEATFQENARFDDLDTFMNNPNTTDAEIDELEAKLIENGVDLTNKADIEEAFQLIFGSGFNNESQTSLNGEIVDTTIGDRQVKVDSSIKSSLESANRAFKEATGNEIIISESFRTHERQKELFEELSKTGAQVAPPGSSFHEKGLAFDVVNWEEAEPFLRKLGFKNDLPNDRGHFSKGEFS